MLNLLPAIAIILVSAASLLRGAQVRRTFGDRPWAFGAATGAQRFGGLVFAGSILTLAVASVQLAAQSDAAGPAVTAGAILAVLGSAVVLVAQIQMGRAWRVGVRHGDAPLFVRHGLFRFSRNPIFVGMMLIGLGVAVATGWWWTWVAAVLFAGACRAQVGIEESHLDESFGTPYQDYRAAVPRWFWVSR